MSSEAQEPSSSEPVVQDASASPSTSTPSSTKLFLGGLSWNTTEDKLRSYFAKFGEVQDVVVMKDRTTKQPRGFGFVTFSSPEAAQQAVQQGPHSLDERMIDCKFSTPLGATPPARGTSKKIFVGGLAPETTDEEFRTHFSTFGKIAEAQIMVDYTSGRSRGFGFITFEDEDAVNSVFTAGSMHVLGGKQVEVKTATPKGSGPQAARAPMPSGRGGYSGGRGGGGRGGYEYAPQGYGMGYGYAGYGMPGQYGMPPYGPYGGMMQYYGQYGYGPQAGYGAGYGQATGYGTMGMQHGGGDGGRMGGRRGGGGPQGQQQHQH